VEIRVQFKDVTQGIFKDIARNELVFRIQPSEAIYLKFNAKTPGLYSRAMPTEMDLTYKRRFAEQRIPEAYEALILDCLKGDKSNFVRNDELDVAWKVRNGSFGIVPLPGGPVFYGIESGYLLLFGSACWRSGYSLLIYSLSLRNLFEPLDLHTYPPLDRRQARPKTKACTIPLRFPRAEGARPVHSQPRLQAGQSGIVRSFLYILNPEVWSM